MPDGATPEDMTESTGFKFVLAVLRALATHDDRIIEWFKARTEKRTSEVGGIVDFDLGTVLRKRLDAEEFAQQIELKCWNRVARLSFRSYDEARAWAVSLNLVNRQAWRDLRKKASTSKDWPADIPGSPEGYYQGRGWRDWGDFLDTGRFRVSEYLPYAEAREWVRSAGAKTRSDFEKLNRPTNIPSTPETVYCDEGWIGWGDFLGTGRIANYLRELWPYEKAREFAHKLNLRTSPEWKDYCDGKRPDLPPRPPEVPYSPFKSYQGKGWVSWDAFLAPRWRAYPLARDFAHSLKLS
ncbi:MAG: hypothetical protein MUE42_14745, partial [Opitutaceae bacterium]|nr:hypothetical protein [Opitutaceae bacterium]